MSKYKTEHLRKQLPIIPILDKSCIIETFDEYTIRKEREKQIKEYANYLKIKRKHQRIHQKIQEAIGYWKKENDGRQYIKRDGSKGVFVPYEDSEERSDNDENENNDKGTLIASNPLVRRANRQWDRDNKEIQRKARIDNIKTAAKENNNKYINIQKGKYNGKIFDTDSLKLDYNNLNDESRNIIKIYKIEDRIKNFDFDKIKDKNGNVIKKNGKDMKNIKSIKKLKNVNGVIYDGKIHRGGININNKLIRVIYDDKQNILDVFIENHKSDYNKRKNQWIEKYKKLNENKNFKNLYL
jgi:hypothetical protein